MKLVVGLGNPGKKFQKTRHNIGFRAIEEFAKENNFPEFKFSKKFASEISERILDGEKIVLLKPHTFMNLSGKSVKLLTSNYKLQTTNLYVVHDDIDLPLGKIKIAIGRGAAGHKGVESIIKELKTKKFVRFRIGIQPKTGKPPKQSFRDATGQAKNAEKFVLRPFNKDEEKIVSEVIKKTIGVIEMTLKERVERAMSRFN